MTKTKKMKVLYSSRTRQRSNRWGMGSSYIEVSYEDNCIRITPALQPAMVCETEAGYGDAPSKRHRKP